jgi:hypothetical protein
LSEVIEHGLRIGEDPEAGRRGAHLPEQASQGGRAVVQKYGRDYMADLGRKGSRAVIRKYGLRFYSEIAARNKGVKKRRQANGDPPH